MSPTATPTRDVTAGITDTAATTGTTAEVGVMAIAAIATTTAVTATSVASGIEVRGDRAVAAGRQGADGAALPRSCARMASMRLRLTPRSLSPSRDAERTWITPAAGSYQNSVSSTKRNQELVNCA